jgi:DNA-binding IscR family transcriptional regulator
MIFLFGAELAYTAANINQIWRPDETEPAFVSPADALAVTLAVARAFEAGRGPAPVENIAAQVRLPEDAVRALLDRLAAREFVCAINGEAPERYVLGKPPAALRVSEILEVGERRVPQGPISTQHEDPAALAADVQSKMRATVATLSLADLLAEKGSVTNRATAL